MPQPESAKSTPPVVKKRISDPRSVQVFLIGFTYLFFIGFIFLPLGLVFSQAVTLYITPVIYLALDRFSGSGPVLTPEVPAEQPG